MVDGAHRSFDEDDALNEHQEALRRVTKLYLNCLEDLPEEAGGVRAGHETNTIAFVALHLLDVRYFLAGYVGLDVDNPYAETLEGARGIDDVTSFPPLRELVARWREVSESVDVSWPSSGSTVASLPWPGAEGRP